MIRRTPIHTLETAQGAQFEQSHSCEFAESFGNPAAEYQAVRNYAGALDLGYLGILRAAGRDRIRYLHNMLSNDIKNLQSGSGCHATLLTHQGHMESDLFVYADADSLWLECPPAGLEKAKATLIKYIVSDVVVIEDWTEKLAILSLQGPGSQECMTRFLGQSIAALPPLGHSSLPGKSGTWRVVHRDRSGSDGYDLWIPTADAEGIWRQWTIDMGVQPVGHRALNWMRTEAGIPWYGADMDERTLPMEMGLDSAISLNKGCYRGQEIVARILHRGHLNRRLTGLSVNHAAVPSPGSEVRAAEVRVGEITSAIFSPRLQKPLALAVVKMDFLKPGTRLEVVCGAEVAAAEVISLPLPRLGKGK